MLLSLDKEKFRADGTELAKPELECTDTAAHISRRHLDKKQHGTITELPAMLESVQWLSPKRKLDAVARGSRSG